MMNDIENQETRREQYKFNPAGIKGLAEGHEHHMLDFIRFFEMNWDALEADSNTCC